MTCPICQKRKPGRFCPAKAEKICAVCCGTEREVTIDCPSDCGYLLSAHRYENEHPRALPADTPLLDVRITSDTIHTHGRFLSAIAFTIAKFCATQPSTTDPDVLATLCRPSPKPTKLSLPASSTSSRPPPTSNANSTTHSPPSSPNAKQNTTPASFGPVKDSEIFQLLVFLFRMGLLRTNGRPRSRRFIEFLRGQFPGAQELQREQSRIIVP